MVVVLNFLLNDSSCSPLRRGVVRNLKRVISGIFGGRLCVQSVLTVVESGLFLKSKAV